jgi:hypothetical protein
LKIEASGTMATLLANRSPEIGINRANRRSAAPIARGKPDRLGIRHRIVQYLANGAKSDI